MVLQECGGSIQIYNTHLDMWGIDVETLDVAAEENTPSLRPIYIKSIWDVVAEKLDNLQTEGQKGTPDMLILSNLDKVHGAAAMLYPGSMEQMAERLQANFYILPSSIHETIIMSAEEADNPEHLISMVREVNETTVNEEEILGNNIYFYDTELKEIKLVA